MRNEEQKLIDQLLKEAAREKNAALPLDAWKETLLAAAKEQQQAQNTPAAREAEEREDELLALRKRRAARIRRMTIGFSTAAAALLIVLGIHTLLENNTGSVPQEYMQRSQSDASPYGSELEKAAGEGGPSLYDAAPRMAPDDALDGGAATPFSIAGGTAEGADTGGASGGSNDATLPEPARDNMLPAPADPFTTELPEQEQAAIDAVREALAGTTVEPLETNEFAYVFYGGRRGDYTIEPLTVGITDASGNASAPTVDVDDEIYIVVLDSRDQNAPQYAVDIDDGVVLGRIVE